MRHHVDFAETRRRVVLVAERMHRHIAADRRVKTGASAAATHRRNLYVAEQSIDGRSDHRSHQRPVALRKLQPAVPLQCLQQGRDHHHKPLAAHNRKLPTALSQRPGRHRICACVAVPLPALVASHPSRTGPAQRACDASPSSVSSPSMRPFSRRPADW